MPNSLFPSASPATRARLDSDETLKLVNEFDWGSTSIGPIALWAEPLKAAVRMMMASTVPMVLLIGAQGIMVYNHAYSHFAGGRHPKLLGSPVLEGWPEVADFNARVMEVVMAGGTLDFADQELVLHRHGVPEQVWMNLNYSPVLDENGTPLAVLAIVLETTQRVLAEQALARSEERLSLALHGSSLVGTWDWDLADDVVTSDDRFAELYGVDPLRAGLGVPLSEFLEAVHPDDRERVRREIDAVIASAGVYRSEYRLVGDDGDVRWVVASGRVLADKEGHPRRLPGVLVDVTDQKDVAEALAESEQRFRILADTMPQMVWSTLPDGYHDYYNARWYEFTGVPEGSTDGEGWNEMFHPDDRERAWTLWRHSVETGDPYQIEYRLRHRSGQYRWVLGRALPIRNENGEITRWFGTCTDIHEAKSTAEEREVIAQELSHRIKNIFAVLTAIISMSARAHPEMKQLAEDLKSRIHALAQAHDFVRPQGRSSKPEELKSLHGLIRELLSPYISGPSERIILAGADTEIDDAAATPLALLFHELATNAAKYGALSKPDGQVHIQSAVQDGDCVLAWEETGAPTTDASAIKDGFGSRLVKLSVEGQLHGRLSREWRTGGLWLEIRVPTSALNRSSSLLAKDQARTGE